AAVEALPMGDPWGSRTAHLLGLTIPYTRVAALVVGLAVIAACFAWFRRCLDPGRRAGQPRWPVPERLPATGLTPTTAVVALHAFPAAIIGGLDSTEGAVVGGLLVGVPETLTKGAAPCFVTYGYAQQAALAQTLEAACKKGDQPRAGPLSAFHGLGQ